jgi:uncharacterized protein
MKWNELKTEIKNDLKGLKEATRINEGFGVVAFGSQVKGESRPKSDIDIAIVTGIHNREKNLEIWKKALSYNVGKYDIKIFELLPLRIKISIIKDYKVIFGDEVEISEYFYQYRKQWMDSKHRVLSQF